MLAGFLDPGRSTGSSELSFFSLLSSLAALSLTSAVQE